MNTFVIVLGVILFIVAMTAGFWIPVPYCYIVSFVTGGVAGGAITLGLIGWFD